MPRRERPWPTSEYTQNIDGIERRAGLTTGLEPGPGEPDFDCVLLHGDLGELLCMMCGRTSDWTREQDEKTADGIVPGCPHCDEVASKRRSGGRRATAVGRVRLNIVLYGEETRGGDAIGKRSTLDRGLGPDLLLVVGTSLQVKG
ncbi:hypothetical protein IMZ48_38620, partial [Candidatus Bathyarchaeota archaeon]|nr:hypothetical protein [Candidatus Bathyarchaeota archaeon]